jgi:hypothetical protein
MVLGLVIVAEGVALTGATGGAAATKKLPDLVPRPSSTVTL